MRVLVIEDEPRVAAAISRGLQADGFCVEVVHDGVEGLWLATEHDYSLVILDLLLPNLNGYRVCAAIRDAGRTMPILILTAKLGDDDQVEALEAGADDYLTKPFVYKVLLAHVRALLRRASSEPAPRQVYAGPLAVDLFARRATLEGTELRISQRALAVLEYLVRHEGEVVSKTDILADVWDHDFDGDPNIVEVYVSRLRQAIQNPGGVAIETIRGAGYRLVSS